MHPWQADRLEIERVLLREYGLKNKTELWKQNSQVKRFIDKFKDTSIKNATQAKMEKDELLSKMIRMGIISRNAKEEEVLGLNVKNVLERRLQTLVYRKNLSHSVKQARQLITHRHITVGGKVVTSPSYIVRIDEQDTIGFVTRSPMFDETHPERVVNKVKDHSSAASTPAQAVTQEDAEEVAVHIEDAEGEDK